jgi:hypothetical protein
MALGRSAPWPRPILPFRKGPQVEPGTPLSAHPPCRRTARLDATPPVGYPAHDLLRPPPTPPPHPTCCTPPGGAQRADLDVDADDVLCPPPPSLPSPPAAHPHILFAPDPRGRNPESLKPQVGPNELTSMWMLTTYLDDTLRVSRDDSGRVFVLLKDVSLHSL